MARCRHFADRCTTQSMSRQQDSYRPPRSPRGTSEASRVRCCRGSRPTQKRKPHRASTDLAHQTSRTVSYLGMVPIWLSFRVWQIDLRCAATGYAGLILLAAPACGPDTDFPEVGELQYEGEYVDVYASPGTTICEGSFAEIDRFSHELRLYAEQTNVPWMREKFRYNWLTGEEWSSFMPCDPQQEACLKPANADHPSAIYARGLYLHEVVHAIYGPAYYAHPIFAEGLAIIMADGIGVDAPFDKISLSVLHQEVDDVLSLSEYSASAFTTRVLLDHFGSAALQAMASTRNNTSFPDLERVLGAHGLPIEDIDRRLINTPTCELAGMRLNLPECTGSEVEWSTLSRSLSQSLSCNHKNTHGPVRGGVYRTISFTVPERDIYEVSISGDNSVTGTMGRCYRSLCESTDGGSSNLEITLTPNDSRLVSLAEGNHWISIRGRPDTAAEVTLFVRPARRPTDTSPADEGGRAEDPETGEGSTSTTDTQATGSPATPDSTEETSAPSEDTSALPQCDALLVCMPPLVSEAGFEFQYGNDASGQSLVHIITSEASGTVLDLCSCQLAVTFEALNTGAEILVQNFEILARDRCLEHAQDEIAAAVEAQDWPLEQVETQVAVATAAARSACEAGIRRRDSTPDGAAPLVVNGQCIIAEPEQECQSWDM